MSLNNATKEQFMNRTASFSTHGSRKGFVDIELEITEDQLNSLEQQKRELLDKLRKENNKLIKAKFEGTFNQTTKAKHNIQKIQINLGQLKSLTREYNIKSSERETRVQESYFFQASKRILPKETRIKIWELAEKLMDEDINT